jgi:hypothetical protein
MSLAPIAILKAFKYALYFNGTNAYALVPLSSSLEVSSVTLEVMVYRLGIANNYNAVFGMGKGAGSGYPGGAYELFNGANATSIIFQVYNTSNQYKAIGFNAPLNPWTHGACTYDSSSGNAYCYQNGSLSQSATGWASPESSSYTDIYISYELPFMIAYVRVYNRALSQSEIQWNYNNPDSPVTNGLVLWLKADPSYITGSTWVDLSGNGNNATLYNAQLVQLINPPIQILPPIAILSPIA